VRALSGRGRRTRISSPPLAGFHPFLYTNGCTPFLFFFFEEGGGKCVAPFIKQNLHKKYKNLCDLLDYGFRRRCLQFMTDGDF